MTAPDLLGSPGPSPRQPVSNLLVAVTAAGVLLTGAAGVTSAAVLGSSGGQPEDVLPSTTVALVKLDLDPAADQKVAVYRLSRKFPQLKTREETVVDDLVRQAFEEAAGEVDYARDVQPWLGERVAVAGVAQDGEVVPVIAVAVDDAGKAREGLERLTEGSSEDLSFAFTDDEEWAFVAERDARPDRLVDAEQHLSDVSAYRDAVDQLDGNQLVTGWVDVGKAFAALPQELRTQGVQPTGHVVAGLRAEDDAVELTGKALGVKTGTSADATVGTEPVELVRDLPADAVAALGASGLAKGLQQGFDEALRQPGVGEALQELEETLGVDLERDLPAVLGDEVALTVLDQGEAPAFVARSRTDEADRGLAVVRRVLGEAVFGGDPAAAAQLDTLVRRTDDGLIGGTDPAAVDEVLEDGSLGDHPRFRKAVPDAADAGFLLYVDVQRALGLAGADDLDADQVDAVGMSATSSGDGDGTFRLRVTFR